MNRYLLIFLYSVTFIVAILGVYFFFKEPPGQAVLSLPSTMAATIVSSPEDNTHLLYWVIAILSLTVMVSILISFYLYKWRKILLSNSNLVVPEEWAGTLLSLGKDVQKLGSVLKMELSKASDEIRENAVSQKSELDKISGETRNSTSEISSMTSTYMELHSTLDEKDKQIRRLQRGYDAEIFRRFISRFARIEQTVNDFLTDAGDKTTLKDNLAALFEDAFDECGVSTFTPLVGEDYRKAGDKVSENPKTEKTEDPEQAFMIAEILEPGYQIQTGEGFEVIIPSRVKIYKLG
tara:strand:+ start:270 stop:1148 length:879 start_codon:yes stop_codon:yes gene_type:complete